MILSSSQQNLKSNSNIQQKMSLLNIITCKICNLKARNSHLCPNCSKFFCQNCIKTWIRANKCCPSCLIVLQEGALVNCNNLSQDLSMALDNLIQNQASQTEICSQHPQQLSYYCSDCFVSLCSDCIILSNNHKGHKFQKIKEAKINFNEKILVLMGLLRNFKKQVTKNRDSIGIVQLRQTQVHQNKIDVLMSSINKIKEFHEVNFTNSINRFQDLLFNSQTSIAVGNKSFEYFKRELQSLSKPKLVSIQKSQMQDKIIESCQKILSEGNIAVNKDFLGHTSESRIIPEWHETIFFIQKYSKFRENNEIVYSDIFVDNNLEWRLKIYANGVDNSLQKKKEKSATTILSPSGPVSPRNRLFLKKQDYISIYIELKSGVRTSSAYRHKIKVIHPEDETKSISQIYESNFQIGECLGYDHFANISTLYQQGYINLKDDYLKISLSVAPSSYYYACQDKSAIIKSRQDLLHKNAAIIHELSQSLKKIQNFEGKHKSFQQQTQLLPHAKNFREQQLKMLSQPLKTFNEIALTPSLSNSEKLNVIQQNQLKEQQKQAIKSQQIINFEDFRIESYNLQQNNFEDDIQMEVDLQGQQLNKIYKRIKRSQLKNLILH